MKDKFQRFMAGRYGVDELGKYSLYLTIALSSSDFFVRSRFLNGITFISSLFCTFACFPKLCPAQKKKTRFS